MEIDKAKVRTQDEEGEPAPIDQIEGRVEAEMKRAEGSARERVAQGLQDAQLEREGRDLRQEGERQLEQERDEESK